MFWTYAGYIWATNLCFGLLSALAPQWLLEDSRLARAVCGFITAYWGVRLLLQLCRFERPTTPTGVDGRLLVLAEHSLTVLFTALTAVYASAALHD